MGYSDKEAIAAASASTAIKCRICGCKLAAVEGDRFEERLCASCVQRPEARRLLGTKGRPGAEAGTSARDFTPAELSLIRKMHAVLPMQQLLDILNERLAADLGPDAAPYTLDQLSGTVAQWHVPGPIESQDWAATRKFLANARKRGILDRIDEPVIDAFAVVWQLHPKQVMHLKDVILER